MGSEAERACLRIKIKRTAGQRARRCRRADGPGRRARAMYVRRHGHCTAFLRTPRAGKNFIQNSLSFVKKTIGSRMGRDGIQAMISPG